MKKTLSDWLWANVENATRKEVTVVGVLLEATDGKHTDPKWLARVLKDLESGKVRK